MVANLPVALSTDCRFSPAPWTDSHVQILRLDEADVVALELSAWIGELEIILVKDVWYHL